MKKIISVHLNSKVFQMEEDAYASLNNVLNMQWKKQELEAKVAEILEAKLMDDKKVVTYPDVVDALYQLGFSAKDFDQGTTSVARKLYRQPENKMIGGVCTGLGDFFNLDPVIIRIIFVVSFFAWGFGLCLYLVLWIIVPKAPKLLNS